MQQTIINDLQSARAKGSKKFAILIDPDKVDAEQLSKIIEAGSKGKADFILCGGSLLTTDTLEWCISSIKSLTTIPVILFPGSHLQLSHTADALLFLSLISGRNPEYLIGEHVKAVHKIKSAQIEVIPTGYIMVESGPMTAAQYMSNTMPIPRNKTDITLATALAGMYLGMRSIYLEAGSGAENTVPTEMIEAVSNAVNLPLWVGGGIRDAETAYQIASAGADIIVVGTAGEERSSVLTEIGVAVKAAIRRQQIGQQ